MIKSSFKAKQVIQFIKACLILLLFVNTKQLLAQQSKAFVAELFSNHMVLQRGHVLPVWGNTLPNEKVSLTFNGQVFKTESSDTGYWQVDISPQKAGGPFTVVITTKTRSERLVDVYFGDVWLCSGQSNMEWLLQKSRKAEQVLEKTPYLSIRHFKIPKSSAVFPNNSLVETKGWKVANKENLNKFSAVGFYFAQHLQEDISVPIGLLNSTWGGSKIVSWMDANALGYNTNKQLADTILNQRKALRERQLSNFLKLMPEVPFKELGLDEKGNSVWQDMEFDDSAWKLMDLPSPWERRGLKGLDGVVWFRKTFKISDIPTNKQHCYVSLGAIDDSDEVFLNGQKIGGTTNTWNVDRIYDFQANLLRKGENLIAVKVTDEIQRGGFQAKDSVFYIAYGKVKKSLVGSWKYKVALVKGENLGKEDYRMPGLIYNKMIHPLHKFPVKGILWYQGESDAYNKDAFLYRDRFKRMITAWRSSWKNDSIPFLFVQLANYQKPQEKPVSSSWAMLRESQGLALDLPATAQAVIIDLGEPDEIHPENKSDVGKRLALAAKAIAYKKNIVYEGPTFSSFDIEAGKVTVHYKKSESKMVSNTNSNWLNEFAIAGSDKKFYKAKAKLINGIVEVWSENVPKPVAIRYAWADNPDKVNLYNQNGLPAVPFRTDNWDE